MKAKGLVSVFLLAAFSFGVFTAGVPAAFAIDFPVVDEDFNGKTFAGLGAAWQSTSAGSGQATVIAADPDDPDNDVLKIRGGGGENNRGAAAVTFSAVQNNAVLTFRIRPGDGVKPVVLYNVSNQKVAEIRFSPPASGASEGNVIYQNGSGNPVIGTYTKDIWQTVTLSLKFSANQVTVQIGGGSPSAPQGFLNTSAPAVTKLEFQSWIATGDSYFDDVTLVEDIPDNRPVLASLAAIARQASEEASGGGLGEYPAASVQAITAAIERAEELLEDGGATYQGVQSEIQSLHAALTAFRASFNADETLTENYDDEEIGTLPTAWENKSVVNAPTAGVAAATVEAAERIKTLKLASGTVAGERRLERKFAPLTGRAVIGFKMLTSTVTGVKPIIFYNSLGTEVMRVTFANNVFRVAHKDGFTDYGAFSANTWYDVQITFDLDADQFYVSINGVEIAQKETVASVADVALMAVTTGTVASASVEIDDLYVKGYRLVKFDEYTSGAVTAKVRVRDADVNVYTAWYSLDKSLKGVSAASGLQAVDGELSVSCSPADAAEADDYAVIFIWDGDLKPVAAVSKLTF